jgi:FkbM family methyltransferase
MAKGRGKAAVKAALRKAGFELQRFDPEGSYAKRRQRLLESSEIDTVVDVGAHAGEFGQSLRHGGYRHQIISFEPQASMYERLEKVTATDPRWQCRNQAVGAAAGRMDLHISGNEGFSSSIRKMATIHEEAEPTSSYIESETVEVTTLDEALAEHGEGRLMLKVDTQGYEAEVLKGAATTLRHCWLAELELVLVELYEGQARFPELVEHMQEQGLLLTAVESGFRDPRTSELLQIDGLFVRA